jgi:hypothetical protein
MSVEVKLSWRSAALWAFCLALAGAAETARPGQMFTVSATALDAGWSVVTNAGAVSEGGADDVLEFLGGATMHGALQAI